MPLTQTQLDPRTFTNERRWSVRRNVNMEFASGGLELTEYVNNLSRLGAFIRSDDPLPVGTRVALKFTVIVRDLEIIEGTGQVVRVVDGAAPEGPGMGVSFLDLTPESRNIIERLLVHT